MKREIPVNQISGFCIGQTENEQAGTGCTVIIGRNGMCAGLDIRGGGPASRDAGILHPLASAGTINAVVLAGGSAFGLDAAGGVMEYLEQRGIGFDQRQFQRNTSWLSEQVCAFCNVSFCKQTIL